MTLCCPAVGSSCYSCYQTLPLPDPNFTIQHHQQQRQQPIFSPSQTKNKTTLTRRTLNFSILLGLPSMPFFFAALPPILYAETAPEQLERYTDEKEGFTLMRPASWVKVEKAGATVLFEDPGARANSLGIVVSPVRISSLGDFGSPQDVAQKLIQAEKRKESTKDAEVIQVDERQGDGGLQVYEFEYKVDSTRGGIKRIFTAAFVASRKLYLLNIAYADRPDNPIDFKTRMMLEQVLHSFDFVA